MSAGTRLVNGTSTSVMDVTVQNSGSVFGGTGTISAQVRVTTGTLNPGANGSAANVGKLSVGSLTLSSTAPARYRARSATLPITARLRTSAKVSWRTTPRKTSP